ncbi:TIGR04255 family protein [Bradyrhizobium zhanjiangense]|uniref:TIGR04255 family protein n=1 Tax=Bradyrhizobium zhanjiangense TaxID=1325107 RepID=A0A4Q0SA08_9BRAD|nr:TIGR04255 family protein [Bradyrhizobium zhanjiangense]RXH31986.1 hypothetical protein XH94_32490 [Bradyrhizobium zhanjiangense]
MSVDTDGLPEFENPPLNEVVLGVQFQSPSNFQEIRAYEVWRLYADRFPNLTEQPPMLPQFETFGAFQPPQIAFSFGPGLQRRYWFESAAGDELIQFQHDRLFHNWRKRHPERANYPRFEYIIAEFERELLELERYVQGLGNERLVVTQCEVAYFNSILLEPGSDQFAPQQWFAFLSPEHSPVESFSSAAGQVLRREGEPYGRLFRESATGFDGYRRPAVFLNLTARGLPATNDVPGALDFLNQHRYIISQEFIRATTPAAQQLWKRTR